MPDPSLPPIASEHTATFRGRGAAMPFTTPWLAGARIRSSDRTGLELVVPNPSGARGIYVVQWPGVRQLCNPTVHDTMLFRRCSRLPATDPASVREAALEVALEGHAGRAAMARAEMLLATDESERLRARFLLMTRLLEHVDPHGAKTVSPTERTAAFDRRAGAVLHRIALSLGRTAADLAAGLALAGQAFAATGIGADDREARVPRLLDRLREVENQLSDWLAADPHHNIGGLGRAILASMATVRDCAETVLRKNRMALADPLALLSHWARHGSAIVARANRCDWLLDGWERVALLWHSAATPASRRAALLEIASLMPVLPQEATEWTDTTVAAAAMELGFKVTSRENAWRTGGAAFALIGRNETLLARSN